MSILQQLTTVSSDPESWAQSFEAFVGRLGSDRARLIISLLVAVILGGVVSAKNAGIGVFAILGNFFLAWTLYNAFTGERTPIFVGQKGPTSMWDIATRTTLSTLFFIGALLIGFAAFFYVWSDRKKGVGSSLIAGPAAIFAGVGTWWSVMFLYYLVVVQLMGVS